ncbi:hypothetical protein [Methylobacterium nodulans]|uniref:hypothetical protein n=1 Tax=Methylobacterium nodulans TaxID=114616 RepID=UPI0012ED3686|nr:hypothetical protein [Methylobacterium nodulans]
MRALTAVADGSQVQCMLWVGALNSSFMKTDAQQQGDRVELVATNDRDMAKTAKDARGQPVYVYGEVPSNTYPRLQPRGVLGDSKSVDTMAVDALFVVSLPWINANGATYDKLLRDFAAAKPEIQAIANPAR